MPAAAKKAKPAHPPYAVMIKEAIVTLKERTGSSRQALRKFIGAKYKLPDGWEKKLSLYLKRMTVEGALVQVKASWKLGEKLKKVESRRPKKKAMTKAVAKPKAAAKKTAGKRATTTKKATSTGGKKVKTETKKSRPMKKTPPRAKKPVKKAPAAAKKKPTRASNKRTGAAAKK